MKPFSLKEYLKNPSRKIITRGGSAVKIHCTNYQGEKPIIAEMEGLGHSFSYNKEGRYFSDGESLRDLFFAPKKKEGWVNIIKSRKGVPYVKDTIIFSSRERAETQGKADRNYVSTVKIEWEE